MKALIFIHGYSSDRDDFKYVYEEVKDKYDYIFLENLPGHETDDLDDFNCVDTVIMLKRVCDDVFSKYDEVDVVGYSMGGALTTMLSLEYNFRRIVLVSPANKYVGLGNTYKKIPFHLKALFSKDEEAKEISKLIQSEDRQGISALFNNRKKYHHRSLSNFMMVIDYCNEKLRKSNKKLESVAMIYGSLDQVIPIGSINFLNDHCENIKYHEINYANHLLLTSDYKEKVVDLIVKELDAISLRDIMSYKNFCLIGKTEDEGKYAYKIKKALLENGYNLVSLEEEFDILNLCINPIKGLEILQNIKSVKGVLIQPGAESDDIVNFLEKEKIPYLKGCSLKGIELITK